MNVVELFAGAGGAAIGLGRAGMRHQLCIEWDTAACTTLQHAGLPALCHDLREPLPFTLAPRPDVVWASPPCQAWSTAGKRKGAQDERNGWPFFGAKTQRYSQSGNAVTPPVAEALGRAVMRAANRA